MLPSPRPTPVFSWEEFTMWRPETGLTMPITPPGF